jgi:hypothetical protein
MPSSCWMDATFIAYRIGIAEAAARHRREMAEAGCLFSYSVSLKDSWYRRHRVPSAHSPRDASLKRWAPAERTYRPPSGAASSRSPSPALHGVAHVCPIAAKHGTALPYGIGRRGQLNVKFRAGETANAQSPIWRHIPFRLGL